MRDFVSDKFVSRPDKRRSAVHPLKKRFGTFCHGLIVKVNYIVMLQIVVDFAFDIKSAALHPYAINRLQLPLKGVLLIGY